MNTETNSAITVPLDGRTNWEKRLQAVQLYNFTGNLRAVAEKLNMPYDSLSDWKRSAWWPELMEEVRNTRRAKMGNNLTNIVENSIDVITDRLENGDWVLNNKTGEIVRKPVSMKDAATVANNLLTRQMQLEELQARMDVKQETVQETLKALADEFKKFNRMQKTKDAETVEFKES